MSSPSRARPPSIDMSVMTAHFAVASERAGTGRRFIFFEKILDRQLAEIGQGAGAAFHGPSPTTRARPAGRSTASGNRRLIVRAGFPATMV